MNRVYCSLLLLLFVFDLPGFSTAADEVVIRNATIYDGSGGLPATGHISFKEGKITSVGPGPGPEADWEIDASGLVVAPGFIDLHTHSDSGVTTPENRGCVNYLIQGCTTSVTGNCGSGPVDVKKFYDKIDLAGAGTNVAHLLPQGTMRLRVIGKDDRSATAEELMEMRRLARLAMQEGAWGMSTGLIYTPGSYSSVEELIEVAKEIAAGKGIYASHIRNEDVSLSAAIQEAIQIGQAAGCPTHISHLKAAGVSNWGAIRVAIDHIEQARKKGQTVTADQYPYVALSTGLEPILFPNWAKAGGTLKLIERLNTPETADRIRAEVSQTLRDSDDGERILITRMPRRPENAGKTLKQLADAEGKTSLEMAEAIVRGGGARIIYFAMNEEDMRMAMVFPWVATGSDGSAMLPGPSRPHPRSFGTFARKIGKYSIREDVLPLEQAIRSSSGLPADIIGLTDRGYLKQGYAADIVVFDPKKYIDTATFEDPCSYAEGVQYVFVNGTLAVSEGIPTGALAGKALRKQP